MSIQSMSSNYQVIWISGFSFWWLKGIFGAGSYWVERFSIWKSIDLNHASKFFFSVFFFVKVSSSHFFVLYSLIFFFLFELWIPNEMQIFWVKVFKSLSFLHNLKKCIIKHIRRFYQTTLAQYLISRKKKCKDFISCSEKFPTLYYILVVGSFWSLSNIWQFILILR